MTPNTHIHANSDDEDRCHQVPPPQKQVDVMEKESTVRDLIGDVCVKKCA